MSADLGLDPSDPLNLLLHNTSQRPESSTDDESTAAQDWSKFSSLWTDHTDQSVAMKPYTDIMDFADLGSLSMDMDFDPSMTIEPSALHYDQFNSFSAELLSSQFPFTFQSALAAGDISSASASPVSYNKERRLSITSSSSSGASFSPVPESLPSPQSGCASDSVQPKAEPSQTNANPHSNDLAAELAQRVRQSAGVMLAVQMVSQFQGCQQTNLPPNISQSKLPIPRLPYHNSASVPKSSSSSSTASTPPPSTPPAPLKLSVKPNLAPTDVSPALTPTSTVPATALPRPKTSHTTIERRYRTNLNARIQSLRMAVPALRVLEDKEGGNGKKIKKNVKGGVVVKGSGIGIIESDDGSVIDVIDERGFVDGVKVARKCSKANVLGKAVEYIRVLKKREHRLKAEQAGLKTLIGGLVGGPALVKEWEREWKAKFGGEEQDEVEGEDEEGDDEDSEDDEGEEGEEESGKKRKRPRISLASKKVSVDKATKKPVPPVVVLANDQVPEKRKRGRPRKVLPSTVAVAPRATTSPEHQNPPIMQDETMHPPTSFSNESQWVQQQQSQPQQFLLAVFGLFSFFNSPLTSSSSFRHDHHYSHTGTVLNALHPPLAYAPDIISQFAAPSPNNMTPAWSWQDYIQTFHLLVSVMVLASFIGSWFGIGFGSVLKKAISVRGSPRGGDKTVRRQGAVDWIKMGEQSIVEGKVPSLSLYERVQIYRSVSRKSETSVGDLATLALIARGTTGVLSGLGRLKARSIWAGAQDLVSGTHPKPPTLKINEKLVFETLSVDEAFDRLALASSSTEREDEDGRIFTPLQILGCLIVKERVKEHVGRLFVQVVAHAAEGTTVNDEEEREEEARRMTVDAARELGGHVEKLGKTLERIWKTAFVEDDDLSYFVDSESMESNMDHEIKALFTALVLYRRIFAARAHPERGPSSTLLSPPPSPTPKSSAKYARMLLELRKALGNRVFDVEGEGEELDDMEGGCHPLRALGLEDARDRVVDMIVDVERRERGVSLDSSSTF